MYVGRNEKSTTIWRRGLMASVVALALVAVMNLNNEAREFELSTDHPTADARPSSDLEEVSSGYVEASVKNSDMKVGDPPHTYSSPVAAAQQAQARVAAMRHAYPDTWEQGAAHKSAYPFPSDGSPPKEKPTPKKLPGKNLARAAAAAAAITALEGMKHVDSKTKLLEHTLSRQAHYLSAPVHVPPSTAPKAASAAEDGDSISPVLPLAAPLKPVSWRKATALRTLVQNALRKKEAATAITTYDHTLHEKTSAAAAKAAVKERRWKPAYKKAQEKAARLRTEKQKTHAAEVKAAQSQAMLENQASLRAEKRRKQIQAHTNELLQKNQASVNSMEDELPKMKHQIQELEKVQPVGPGNLPKGKLQQIRMTLDKHEHEATLERARALKSKAEKAEEYNRKDEQTRMALQGMASSALTRFDLAAGFKDVEGLPEEHFDSPEGSGDIKLDLKVKQLEAHASASAKKVEQVRKAAAQAKKESLLSTRKAARLKRQSASEHLQELRNYKELQAQVAKDAMHAKVTALARKKKKKLRRNLRKLQKQKAKEALHKDAVKQEELVEAELSAATKAEKVADKRLVSVAKWEKAHPKSTQSAARKVIYGNRTPRYGSRKPRHAISKGSPTKSHGAKRLKAHLLSAARTKSTHESEDSQVYSTMLNALVQEKAHTARTHNAPEAVLLEVPLGAQKRVGEATVAARVAKNQAKQATDAHDQTVQEAEKGLQHVTSLEKALSAAEEELRPSHNEHWTPAHARQELLAAAYQHAKAAFEGSATAYADVVRRQKLRKQRTRAQHVEQKEKVKKSAEAAWKEVRRMRMQETALEKAQLLAIKAEAVKTAAAKEAEIAMQNERLRAHQEQEAKEQSETAEVQRRIGELKSSMQTLKKQAGKELAPHHEALIQYSKQLEEAILAGASVRSVVRLMHDANRAPYSITTAKGISKTLRVLSTHHAGISKRRMTASEELHMWEGRGQALDRKIMQSLQKDIEPHG